MAIADKAHIRKVNVLYRTAGSGDLVHCLYALSHYLGPVGGASFNEISKNRKQRQPREYRADVRNCAGSRFNRHDCFHKARTGTRYAQPVAARLRMHHDDRWPDLVNERRQRIDGVRACSSKACLRVRNELSGVLAEGLDRELRRRMGYEGDRPDPKSKPSIFVREFWEARNSLRTAVEPRLIARRRVETRTARPA